MKTFLYALLFSGILLLLVAPAAPAASVIRNSSIGMPCPPTRIFLDGWKALSNAGLLQ